MKHCRFFTSSWNTNWNVFTSISCAVSLHSITAVWPAHKTLSPCILSLQISCVLHCNLGTNVRFEETDTQFHASQLCPKVDYYHRQVVSMIQIHIKYFKTWTVAHVSVAKLVNATVYAAILARRRSVQSLPVAGLDIKVRTNSVHALRLILRQTL